MATGLLA